MSQAYDLELLAKSGYKSLRTNSLYAKSVRTNSLHTHKESLAIDIETEELSQEEVTAIQLPRKITMFRVIVERKLGIDWEHGEESDFREDEENKSRNSFQTNQAPSAYKMVESRSETS